MGLLLLLSNRLGAGSIATALSNLPPFFGATVDDINDLTIAGCHHANNVAGAGAGAILFGCGY